MQYRCSTLCLASCCVVASQYTSAQRSRARTISRALQGRRQPDNQQQQLV